MLETKAPKHILEHNRVQITNS